MSDSNAKSGNICKLVQGQGPMLRRSCGPQLEDAEGGDYVSSFLDTPFTVYLQIQTALPLVPTVALICYAAHGSVIGY